VEGLDPCNTDNGWPLLPAPFVLGRHVDKVDERGHLPLAGRTALDWSLLVEETCYDHLLQAINPPSSFIRPSIDSITFLSLAMR